MVLRYEYARWEERLSEFRVLLDGESENDVHRFMTENTEYIPTFNVLNHGVFHNVVFNKFAFGDFVCDFLYVTKSSDEVRLVFVEIEGPKKPLLRESHKLTGPTTQLTYALDQVRSWRLALEGKALRDVVTQQLNGFTWYAGTQGVRLTLAFLLVIGRRPKGGDQTATLAQIALDSGVMIKTFDSVADQVARQTAEKRFLLQYGGRQFKVANFDAMPTHLWLSVDPDRLKLTDADIATFRKCDCPVDEWLARKKIPTRPLKIGYYEDKFDELVRKVAAR